MDKTPVYIEPDEIRRRTRRSLLVTGAAAALGGVSGNGSIVGRGSTVSMHLSEKSWTLMPQLHEGSSERKRVRPSTSGRKLFAPFGVTETLGWLI